MKIGFLITYFYPKMGGAEANCYYLARELAKRHEVHVFCSGEKENEEILDGMHVHRSKELFRIKYYLAYYPSIIPSLARYNLDVLHVHGFGFMQHDKAVACIKKKYPSLKLVCTPHGPFMALKKYSLLGSLFKNTYTPLIRKSLKDYDAVIQVNPFQKKWLVAEYRVPLRKIHFVPNGVPASAFKPVPAKTRSALRRKYALENKFIISYVGRIQKYKGLDQVIRVMSALIKKNPNIVFLAMGKDVGDKQRLQRLAEEHGVTRHIVFTGEISEIDKYALLDESELFVFPSEWEAFGIATLEAMARANAVVSSATEGGRYLIKERVNGFIFPYGNLAQLKKSLLQLSNHASLLKRIQHANLSKAKQFTWEKIAPQLEFIYCRLLNNKMQ